MYLQFKFSCASVAQYCKQCLWKPCYFFTWQNQCSSVSKFGYACLLIVERVSFWHTFGRQDSLPLKEPSRGFYANFMETRSATVSGIVHLPGLNEIWNLIETWERVPIEPGVWKWRTVRMVLTETRGGYPFSCMRQGWLLDSHTHPLLGPP